MSYAKKIADATVQNRTQTPFFSWLRNKLLAVDRQKITPPTGVPRADGKSVYHNPSRYPNTQSARTTEPVNLPGGVHNKLAANYYLDRDGRRSVLPPPALYSTEANPSFAKTTGEPLAPAEAYSKGPGENFGLQAPTPGFGAEWSRSKNTELKTQQETQEFVYFERFDCYAKST
ncbi:unnamed protein product, partial [Mesorhabditis belari]|uniref:NADH dehydrogenase [ubiquinone] 1 alpha subcomplex subunit 7 n=1 Tax=Mesorhabditis belari TaxID=2138241 RepID=A0AAF3J7T3_9BILA